MRKDDPDDVKGVQSRSLGVSCALNVKVLPPKEGKGDISVQRHAWIGQYAQCAGRVVTGGGGGGNRVKLARATVKVRMGNRQTRRESAP